MSVSTGGAWNCGRQYLITEYTGVPVNFTFSYGDLGSASTIISHNIVITNLTTGVVVVNTFPSSGGTGLVLDASGYSFTSTARGEYEIQFFRPGVEANPDSADITGRIVLQTKIPVFYL